MPRRLLLALLSLGLALLLTPACGHRKDAASQAARAEADDDASDGEASDAPPAHAASAKAGHAGSRLAGTRLRPYAVTDRQQGNLVVGVVAVPDGWNARSDVRWNYSDVSFPVRMAMRVSSPDGAAWVESFPSEMFYWLQPRDTRTAVGGRSLGMIHAPGITAPQAMQHFLISRYRGRAQGLRVVGYRAIPNLAQALGKPFMAGDSIAARIHYTLGGHPVDEEIFALLTSPVSIPYHGPQGTTYEFHRILTYAHSMGAADGRLDELHPLLGYVAASWRSDPAWERYAQQINQRLSAQFNQYIAQGYAQIAAAGRLSRAISANNDAMLQTIEAQRIASNRSYASSSSSGSSDAFDQYIRGTERMEDPYWGTSEHSYNQQYHWTDGYGGYQHSNDAGFDPNVGGTSNWTLMQPAK